MPKLDNNSVQKFGANNFRGLTGRNFADPLNDTDAVNKRTLTASAETTTTIGALIDGATAKTTPVDADQIGLMDSEASNLLKKLSWANLKATLKTYFDTLYEPKAGTWADWNPTWVNLTVGNGTLVARYTTIGKTVIGYVHFIFGTSSSIGVVAPGFVYFTLPVTAATAYNQRPIGNVYIENAGVTPYDGTVGMRSTTQAYINYKSIVATSYVGPSPLTASAPFTWGAADFFEATFTYEIS